jgi:hypothetical protein
MHKPWMSEDPIGHRFSPAGARLFRSSAVASEPIVLDSWGLRAP